MWQPKERLKYAPSGGSWPNISEAAQAKLFAPLNYGAMQLRQRTWVPAMVPWRATEEGDVTPAVVDWYRRFAQGKPGAIVVEATGIRDIPSGPLLRIGHDRYIEGLQRISEAVREASDGETQLYIQLIDFLTVRRRIAKQAFLERFLPNLETYASALDIAPGASRTEIAEQLGALDDDTLSTMLSPRDFEDMRQGYRDRVSDVHKPDIETLPQTLPPLFADAAHRAEQAGFDGVELHYAHAYTMASFLSATNQRTDGYGGERENRVKLPLDVFNAVRNRVAKSFAVGCRFLSDECISDGNNVDDAAYFAVQFAKAGFDFLSLSRGGKFDDAKQPKVGQAMYPYTGRSGYECMPQYVSDEQGPFGRNVEPVATIRQAVRQAQMTTPIIVAGGFHNFEQAEGALQNDKADVIAFARQAMADPDWFIKVKQGAGEEVRLCEYTNYCEGLDQKHKQVTCNLWDRQELDQDCLKSHDGKRRLTAPEWQPIQIQTTNKPDS